MSDRSPMTIENRSEEKEDDSWGTNPNNSSNNNKPSIPQFDITKISPNVSSLIENDPKNKPFMATKRQKVVI